MVSWLLVGVLIWLGSFAQAQERRVERAHDTAQACNHCHESPHPGGDSSACADCHTAADWVPSTFDVERHATTPFALEGAHVEVPCARCHVDARLVGLPSACFECHTDRHRGKLGGACENCHNVEAFKPVPDFDHLASVDFALVGGHDVPCRACHEGVHAGTMRNASEVTCASCHSAAHGDLGDDCASCHDVDAGKTFAATVGARVFDHRATGFTLERRHASAKCGSCHTPEASSMLPRCHTCHLDPHAGQMGIRCDDCHRADRWSLARFDHDITSWPLRGRHFVTPCVSCHRGQRWIGLQNTCWSCHGPDLARAPAGVDAHRFGRTSCDDCHSTWSWR